MKKPKPTLLTSDTIQQLRDDGLDPLYIEFFGTISGMALAINNPYPGQRCIKAALTLLSRPRTVEMFRAWTEKRFHPERAAKDLSHADAALAAAKEEQEAHERELAERWQEEHLRPGFNGQEDDDEEEG